MCPGIPKTGGRTARGRTRDAHGKTMEAVSEKGRGATGRSVLSCVADT